VQPSPTLSLKTVYIGAPTPTGTPASPSPSTVASPSPTSTPTPTQSLYDQAVAVYQVFYDEQAKLQAAGGAETLPPEITAVLTGDALTMTKFVFADMKHNGYHLVGTPQFQIVWTRPLTDDLIKGTAVALETCEEISGAMWYDASGKRLDETDDNYFLYQTYFRSDDHGGLVIFALAGDGVDSCAV